MTDNGKHPQLSEEQTDKLLGAFFEKEVPAKLDAPPSSWPQIADRSTTGLADSTKVTAVRTSSPEPAASSSARRGIVVAASTLAACLAIATLSQHQTTNVSPTNPASTTADTADAAESEFMNVSGDPQDEASSGAAVSDDGLTLEELEVDLTPDKDSAPPSNDQQP